MEVFSPSLERVNELIALKEQKDQGIYSGIPLWESFPKLGEIIPTIDKGQVIINVAASGVGKSMITRYKDIVVPWLFVRKHRELQIDLQFVVFLLEDDVRRFKDYILSTVLYLEYGVYINPKMLRSSFKTSLSDDTIGKLKSIIPIVDELLHRCIIEESLYNSYGIYKKCRMLSEQWGTHYYTDMLKEGKIITRVEYNKLPKLGRERFKETSVEELRNEGINPTDYYEYFKYSHYTPSNPKQHVIAVFDNINCLVPDEHEGGLKDAMDNFMYNYLRKNLAKHWNWSCVAVQQNVGGAEEQAFNYKGENIVEKLLPNLSMLGDSKLTQRAAHLIYALFDPFRYGVQEFMGYNIARLKDNVRFLFILKNNDGKSNKVIPLYFAGENSYFKELPDPTQMTEDIYKKIETKQVKP